MATGALTMLVLAQLGVACDHGRGDGTAHEPQDWDITPQPLLQIGAIDGDPAYQFHEIDTVRRLPNGRILVANRGTHELRFYDAEGQHVRSIGKQGSGPGEFRDIRGLELVGGDSLYVFDPTLGRVSVIDTAGTFLDSFRLQNTGDDVRPLRMYRLAGVLETRDIVLVARAWPADMKAVPTIHFDSMATLLYRRDGARLGEVAEPLGMDTYATPENAGDVSFGRVSSASVDSRLIYATDGGEFDIRVYDPYGGLVRNVGLDRPPRSVTQSDIDGLMSYYVGRVPNERRPSVRRYFEDWPRAEHKPWIDGLLVDGEGYVWAQQYEPFWSTVAPVYEIFVPTGRHAGSLETPPRFAIQQIGTDYVIGVWRDELDISYVRIYGLRRR